MEFHEIFDFFGWEEHKKVLSNDETVENGKGYHQISKLGILSKAVSGVLRKSYQYPEHDADVAPTKAIL